MECGGFERERRSEYEVRRERSGVAPNGVECRVSGSTSGVARVE